MATPWSFDPAQNSSPAPDFSTGAGLVAPGDLQQLAALGHQAVASGKISKSQAQKNAQALNLIPSGKGKAAKAQPATAAPNGPADASALTQTPAQWAAPSLSMLPDQAPQGADPDFSMLNSPAQLYQAVSQGGEMPKGASRTASQTDTSGNQSKYVTNTRLTKSPEQAQLEMLLAQGITPKSVGYRHRYDENGQDLGEDRTQPIYDLSQTTTDQNHPYQQQLAGLNSLEGMNGLAAAANAKKDLTNLSPLAALADSLVQSRGGKSSLAEGYQAPVSGNAQIMSQADEIQKRRGDLQKALFENVKNLNGGTAIDQLAQYDMLKNMMGAGQKTPVYDPAAMLEQRNVNRAYMQLVGQIKRDKPLTQMFTQYGNINNALSNIANASHITPQNIDEFQQSIRANLGIKGSSGVGEREKTQLNSLGLNADRVAQFLQGKPADIAKNDDLVRHLQQLAALESANIQDQSAKRLRMAAGGYSYILDDPRYDYLNQSLKELTGATQAQFQPTSLVKRTQGARGGVPSANSVRKSPVPSGNPTPAVAPPDFTKMSNDDLKAYIKANGGK